MTAEAPIAPDLLSTLREVVAAAHDRKAIRARVLRLGEVSDFTEYFVICSGNSQRQVQAIADAVLERLRPEKIRPLSKEGYEHGRWVLLDFGSFVVHVFDEENRSYYGLERLWSDSPDVTDEVGP